MRSTALWLLLCFSMHRPIAGGNTKLGASKKFFGAGFGMNVDSALLCHRLRSACPGGGA